MPTDKWDDVLDASQEGPKCNQFNWFTKGIEGVEDCLKLNVYTHDVSFFIFIEALFLMLIYCSFDLPFIINMHFTICVTAL